MPGLHLTLALGDRNLASDLVRLSNDGLAEYVTKYPDRFKGFAGLLPMNDPDQALIELDRLMKIGALGIQIESNINGVPLDDPRFESLFARMAALERPIWIHPVRSPLSPDYSSEKTSRYAISTALGWPYETSVALSRLVFSGHLERHPKLRIIGHHGGGMIPHFSGRLGQYLETWGPRMDPELGTALQSLKKPLLDYFRMFYVDTALNGAKHAVACVVEFFGPEHVLFGTDTPFDPEDGLFVQDTITDVESLSMGQFNRKQIYNGNALRVLGIKGNELACSEFSLGSGVIVGASMVDLKSRPGRASRSARSSFDYHTNGWRLGRITDPFKTVSGQQLLYKSCTEQENPCKLLSLQGYYWCGEGDLNPHEITPASTSS